VWGDHVLTKPGENLPPRGDIEGGERRCLGDVSTDYGHHFGSAWTHYIAVGVVLWVPSAYEAYRELVEVSEQYPVGIGASCEESSDIQRETGINCRDERRVVD